MFHADKMILKRAKLLRLAWLNRARGAFDNDALLLCEDISALEKKGYTQMTAEQATGRQRHPWE